MREIQEAYKATVVLPALLDTLWNNTNAMSKVLKNAVYGELAKKFSHLYSQAERLQADVRRWKSVIKYYTQCTEDDLEQYAKNLRRATEDEPRSPNGCTVLRHPHHGYVRFRTHPPDEVSR